MNAEFNNEQFFNRKPSNHLHRSSSLIKEPYNPKLTSSYYQLPTNPNESMFESVVPTNNFNNKFNNPIYQKLEDTETKYSNIFKSDSFINSPPITSTAAKLQGQQLHFPPVYNQTQISHDYNPGVSQVQVNSLFSERPKYPPINQQQPNWKPVNQNAIYDINFPPQKRSLSQMSKQQYQQERIHDTSFGYQQSLKSNLSVHVNQVDQSFQSISESKAKLFIYPPPKNSQSSRRSSVFNRSTLDIRNNLVSNQNAEQKYNFLTPIPKLELQIQDPNKIPPQERNQQHKSYGSFNDITQIPIIKQQKSNISGPYPERLNKNVRENSNYNACALF